MKTLSVDAQFLHLRGRVHTRLLLHVWQPMQEARPHGDAVV